MTVAEATPVINPSKTGTGTTVGDSALRRLPTLNRNFADFVTLVPQVSTSTSFLSGGGVNIRQNAIQIDGAAAGDLFGLGATGQPGSQANAKSIPLDAVKEYQVLLSPFDVRQGNFGGMLINAVTKTGSNEFHGTAYGYTRNENLTRTPALPGGVPPAAVRVLAGGPIIKDRLLFFVNPEWQKFRTPTSGPWIGSAGAADRRTRHHSILSSPSSRIYGLTEPGTGAKVLRENPLTNVFARIDAFLPANTRLVLRHNYAAADNVSFGRGAPTSSNPNFALTSNAYKFSSRDPLDSGRVPYEHAERRIQRAAAELDEDRGLPYGAGPLPNGDGAWSRAHRWRQRYRQPDRGHRKFFAGQFARPEDVRDSRRT